MKITIWNEFRHEKSDTAVQEVYPKGIHVHLAEQLSKIPDATVTTATLDEPENGLSDSVIASTDVLVWWAHMAHIEVSDEVVDRVQNAILRGMGLIVLHSGHHAKVFKRMMGTSCSLSWREDGAHERLWVIDPTHPIASGIDRYFEIPQTEMYGEFFDVPVPDETVFTSWFAGGEVFRSGAVWRRGAGKVFYFRPGHETFPIYYQKEVVQVLQNACQYVAKKLAAKVTGIIDAPQVKISPESARSK